MQQREKTFQLILIKEKNLHQNINFLIIESSWTIFLNKRTIFFFYKQSYTTDENLIKSTD